MVRDVSHSFCTREDSISQNTLLVRDVSTNLGASEDSVSHNNLMVKDTCPKEVTSDDSVCQNTLLVSGTSDNLGTCKDNVIQNSLLDCSKTNKDDSGTKTREDNLPNSSVMEKIEFSHHVINIENCIENSSTDISDDALAVKLNIP